VSKNEIYKLCNSHEKFQGPYSLELINYSMYCWYTFEDCHNLKIPKLRRIHLDDVISNAILENYVALETFSLIESNETRKTYKCDRLILKSRKQEGALFLINIYIN
jgi:hypothetical protein